MIKIRIMWEDLSDDFKSKIIQVFGDNCNWDLFPMTTIEIEDERNIVLDSCFGDEGIDT